MQTPELETVLCPITDTRWLTLVASHPQANIFHHPSWARLLSDCYGGRPFVVAVRDSDGGLRAGLPMLELSGPLTGRRWVSLPFTDQCGPLSLDAGSLRCLSDSLINQYRNGDCPKIELRCELPAWPAAGTTSHHVLHTLALCPDSEAVFAHLLPMHRRNVRIAEKRGVRLEWGTQSKHVEIFYRLHLETRRRKGIPIQPRRFFELLSRDLIDRGLGFVLLAGKDGEWLAGAVFLHWQHTLTYKYGASTSAGLSLRPNNLLFWNAIRWGCENGFTLLDLGRTDLADAGLRAFKSGWGAEETPLVYSALPAQPARTLIGRLMPILQKTIRNSPPWVCRAVGELLYRHVA